MKFFKKQKQRNPRNKKEIQKLENEIKDLKESLIQIAKATKFLIEKDKSLGVNSDNSETVNKLKPIEIRNAYIG